MPHPISDTYYDVQIARASAILTAAFDAAPLELPCGGFDNVILNFTYTRGAAGGAFDWQIETSPYSLAALAPAGAAEWETGTIYGAGAVAAGGDTTSLIQREIESYGSQGAAAESFSVGPIELSGTIERMRVPARESGVPGTPGTLQIQAVFS